VLSWKAAEVYRQLLCQSFHVSLRLLLTATYFFQLLHIYVFPCTSCLRLQLVRYSILCPLSEKRHYRPANFDRNSNDEIHYAVPEHWRQVKPLKEGIDELVMVGTSFKEPNCKNLLCSLDETNAQSEHLVTWHGPAPRGKIVTAGWDPVTMTPPKEWEEQNYEGGKGGVSEAWRVLGITVEGDVDDVDINTDACCSHRP
jgi:hypothetical protein